MGIYEKTDKRLTVEKRTLLVQFALQVLVRKIIVPFFEVLYDQLIIQNLFLSFGYRKLDVIFFEV